MPERHSITAIPEFAVDEAEKSRIEARNALRQYDAGVALLRLWLNSRRPSLRPSDLLTLNRYALDDIHPLAGTYRPGPVTITGSVHQPPASIDVPAEVEDFCDYINVHWDDRNAIHLAAYALWRINWIHPFPDGNGRTARILSYILLCARIGHELPGVRTIPDQIVEDKTHYYQALEGADAHFVRRRIDLTKMEDLLEGLLASQLLSVHETATQAGPITGGEPSHPPSAGPVRIEIEVLARTAQEPIDQRNLLERNPVLFNGIFTIVAAILGVILGIVATKLFS